MLAFKVIVKAPDETLVVLSEAMDIQTAGQFMQAACRLMFIQGPGWSIEFQTKEAEESWTSSGSSSG